MAIEDAYVLANDIADALQRADNKPGRMDVTAVFRDYQGQRMLRASAIHGMAGMAAFMASTYKVRGWGCVSAFMAQKQKRLLSSVFVQNLCSVCCNLPFSFVLPLLLLCMQAYLGEGMPGPLANLAKLKIPHPGRMAGQIVMKLTMPAVLGWVLGGNVETIQKSRQACCRIADQPHGFKESSFPLFMQDDEAIVHAARANWMLVTERPMNAARSSLAEIATDTSTSEAKGIYIGEERAVVGRSGAHLEVDDRAVAAQHAHVWRTPAGAYSYDYHVQDLGSDSGERHGSGLGVPACAHGDCR